MAAPANHHKVCAQCEGPIPPGRADRRFCSGRCRTKHSRETRGRGKNIKIEIRVCPWCRQSFTCKVWSRKKFHRQCYHKWYKHQHRPDGQMTF